MEDEVEECVRKKIQWPKLPQNVKKLLGDSHKEYESLEESSSSYSGERRHAALEVHRSYDDVFTPRRSRAEKDEGNAAPSFVETRARDPSVA
ncbi:hypothetical protein MSG28_008828 [Choristoneura fumiferana]|uniref:Uncharacterized protein n=1 Tax=Choristoneura fumiferana TaxID=7141 RepID=A0ACC0J8D1_CHOFU|nr:hypothetical protein MSG28_008828 [Choristoneura fumiferana]